MLHFFKTVVSPNHNYVTVRNTDYWTQAVDEAEYKILRDWFHHYNTGLGLLHDDGVSLCLSQNEYYDTRDTLEARVKELEKVEQDFFARLALLKQPKIFWTPSSTELISMLSERRFDLLTQVGFEPRNCSSLEYSFDSDNFIICPHKDNSYHVLFKSSDGSLEYDLMWEEDLDLKLEEESFPLADFMAYCTCHGSASEFHNLWYKTMTFRKKLCTLIKYCGFAEILA
jgi:hypothetical protein